MQLLIGVNTILGTSCVVTLYCEPCKLWVSCRLLSQTSFCPSLVEVVDGVLEDEGHRDVEELGGDEEPDGDLDPPPDAGVVLGPDVGYHGPDCNKDGKV